MPRARIYATLLWIVGGDLLLLLLSAVMALFVRIGAQEMAGYGLVHLEGWLVLSAAVVLGNYVSGAYTLQHRYSRFNLVLQLLFAILFAVLLVGLFSYTWFAATLGRGVLGLTLGVYFLLALTFKLFWYGYLSHSPRHVIRVGLLRCGVNTAELINAIENQHIVPRHRVVVLLSPGEPADVAAALGLPSKKVVPDTIAEIARQFGLNVLITDFNDHEQEALYLKALKPLRFDGLRILTALGAMERYAGRIPINMASELFPLLDAVETDLLVFGRLKRVIDIVVSLTFGLALLPPALFLAAVIKLTAPRLPVLYTQVRNGQFGQPFVIYKFRTMRPDAESRTGPVWSLAGDDRVTRLGRWMRRFRVDEIPQLINVLIGNMSFVGPRPERPEMIEKVARQVPRFDERLDVLPGLTGWAQIRYPYGDSVEDAARKLEYDLYYIKNMSPLLDLRIIISTLRIVVFGKERVV